MRVDAVVLDIDGVLVDVAESYRRAIVESVQRVYEETIEIEDVQLFKDAGGFNNDWELTYAAALYVLARRAGLDADLEAFTDAIREHGGGLSGARAVLDTRLSTDETEQVLQQWDRERLRAVFQALYLGADLYRELEGGNPPLEAAGYIHEEPVLVDPATIEELFDRFDVGVVTGRPAAEADIALDLSLIHI